MAEERIFVAELTGVQYTCGIGGICSGKCEESGKCGKGISRQEAIERIAKGIARQYDPDRPNAKEYERIWNEELLDRVKQSFRKKAEAALNALLEAQNER